MADDRAGASTTANASGGNREQVPSPAPLLSAVSEKRPFFRRRCIRRPTYGIHHTPDGNLPKKRFPKSPLLGNDSCMRGELNAAQSPLTMSNCAQCEMAGSRLDCLLRLSRLARPSEPIKSPCLPQGLITVLLWLMGSEAEEFGGNSIQAVVAQHLEDDVDQHSSDVESSHQSQASPEFFGCCWGLIVGPGAGSVGHRLIATSTTLAREAAGVQHSSPRLISSRQEGSGECQEKLGIAALE